MKLSLPALLLVALAAPASAANPDPTVRKAVLDALRPKIQAELKTQVEFVVKAIRVEDGWAFVIVDPQQKGGRKIDGHRIFGEDFHNMDGLRVDAVLQHRGGRWQVVEYGLGAMDVWYCDVGPRSLKRGYGC